MITPDGCWADIRLDRAAARNRPTLFLDRDGVLIEDTGYPHRPHDVVLIPEAVSFAGAASRAGFVVGITSNQSGVGRGLFGWDAFCSVQAIIDEAVRAHGGRLDFVLACPHHGEAEADLYRRDDHPWRKPAPGMLLTAAAALELDLRRSAFLGDRSSDMEAAEAAKVPVRLLLGPAVVPGATTVSRASLSEMLPSIIRQMAEPRSRAPTR